MTTITRKKRVSKADRDLIAQIVERAQRVYADRFNEKRLTNALLCAHRAKPIRLGDLLSTCYTDFYHDVINGAYRHYNPKTDTMQNGWTAQHSKPRDDSSYDLLDAPINGHD